MLPEGGRDRLAKMFYHPVFAEGERRASLGDLGMDEAAAAHDRHHAPEHAQGQFIISAKSLLGHVKADVIAYLCRWCILVSATYKCSQ